MILTACLMLCATFATAAELPRVAPEAAALNTDRLARIDARLAAEVEAGAFPGAAMMITRSGRIGHVGLAGRLAANGAPMRDDAIFEVYSLTKPIVTAAALSMVEDGLIDLATPAHEYIPAFEEMQVAVEYDPMTGEVVLEEAEGEITLYDLLRHTAGITYDWGPSPARREYARAGVAHQSRTVQEAAELIATLPLDHHPGAAWEYSRSLDVMGAVMEIVAGQTLAEILKARVFDPLDMRDTGYFVRDTADHGRIGRALEGDRVPAYGPKATDPTVQPKLEQGGSGLVSTLRDMTRFAEMLKNGGTLDGTRVLSPHAVRLMTSDHLSPDIGRGRLETLRDGGNGFGLGLAVRLRDGGAGFGRTGAFGWGGAGGAHLHVDPAADLTVVILFHSFANRERLRGPLMNMTYAAIDGPVPSPVAQETPPVQE